MASRSRPVPVTFVFSITDSSRDGWIIQARCTTTSAPCTTFSLSDEMSATSQLTLGSNSSMSPEGRRRATPTTDWIRGSAASFFISAVPTFPVAPITTTRSSSGVDIRGSYPRSPGQQTWFASPEATGSGAALCCCRFVLVGHRAQDGHDAEGGGATGERPEDEHPQILEVATDD